MGEKIYCTLPRVSSFFFNYREEQSIKKWRIQRLDNCGEHVNHSDIDIEDEALHSDR